MAASIPPECPRHPVLVGDAHERIAVAVIRSLGRAGYPVHTCSDRPYAMGWGSRFTAFAARSPSYDSSNFINWLRDYCRANLIGCIVPSEELLVAIRPAFDEFRTLLPFAPDEATIYRCLSKYDLFAGLARAGAGHLAPHLFVERNRDMPADSEFLGLGLPLYVKSDAVHADNQNESPVIVAHSAADASAAATAQLKTHRKVLVQGHAVGVGIGAFALRWNGEIRARFMHRRLHELPESGWSSYRTSWWHEAIMSDAEDKLAKMNWQGVAMLEYRWDPETDRFWLLEMNGRFWGSLHLALYAGVDFPRLLLDSFHGCPVAPIDGKNSSARCRNFALECRYVSARLLAKNVSAGEKLRLIPEFVALTLDRRVKSDLWFPGDRRVWWLQFWQYFAAATNGGKARD